MSRKGMFVRNEDIREAKGKIPMWVIAERLEVSENTFLNWMKKEMAEPKKTQVFAIINQIKTELQQGKGA